MGAVSQFAAELALCSCTSEDGRLLVFVFVFCTWLEEVREKLLVCLQKALDVSNQRMKIRKKIASNIQYFSRQRAKQEVVCKPVY